MTPLERIGKLTLKVRDLVVVVSYLKVRARLAAVLVDGGPVESSRSLRLCVVVPEAGRLATSRDLPQQAAKTDASQVGLEAVWSTVLDGCWDLQPSLTDDRLTAFVCAAGPGNNVRT